MTAPVGNLAERRPSPPPATGSSSSGESKPDVELIGVTKRFGPVVAVDHMDLAIPSGSFTSLLGPSGCGKTTTLRMIAGFEQPTEGEILLAGRPISGTSSTCRAKPPIANRRCAASAGYWSNVGSTATHSPRYTSAQA